MGLKRILKVLYHSAAQNGVENSADLQSVPSREERDSIFQNGNKHTAPLIENSSFPSVP